MCGIFGKFHITSSQTRSRVDESQLLAMSRTLHHRGPDEKDQFVFFYNAEDHHQSFQDGGIGANRLSFIDLTSGSQPISNEDQTIWACQNGEIYNFQELSKDLKNKGHQFQSQSDTEVLVHLYEDEGENFVKKLRGMFAIAIFDKKQNKLMLARDRIGIKPLYYSFHKNVFLFGSELKSLLAGGLQKQIDLQALGDYLSLNFVPGPRTIFTNAKKLQPGHLLVLKNGKMEIQRFWDVPVTKPVAGAGDDSFTSISKAAASLKELLKDAVQSSLVSDVPVGAFLSGGLDSSAVVAFASRHVHNLQTFSVGFKEKSYNELSYACRIAKQFHTNHHDIRIDVSKPEIVLAHAETFDEPFADSSSLATFALSEFAAKHVKAVLSGDGGDEVFGGYTIYYADRILTWYRHLPKIMKQRVFPWIASLIPASDKKTPLEFKFKRFVRGGAKDMVTAHALWRAIFTEDQKQELFRQKRQSQRISGKEGIEDNVEDNNVGISAQNIKPFSRLFHINYTSHHTNDSLNDLMNLDLKINLVDDMLTKVDRMSMAHSLEVRVPLLDHRLVEFMARVPSKWKLKGRTLKYLFKKAMEDALPDDIIYRPKSGFHVPVGRWLRHEFKPLVQEYLSPKKIRSQGLFDSRVISNLSSNHQNGTRDVSRELWGLLMFSIWYEKWLA